MASHTTLRTSYPNSLIPTNPWGSGRVHINMAQRQRKPQLTFAACSQHTNLSGQALLLAETTPIMAMSAMETEVRRASMIKRMSVLCRSEDFAR